MNELKSILKKYPAQIKLYKILHRDTISKRQKLCIIYLNFNIFLYLSLKYISDILH